MQAKALLLVATVLCVLQMAWAACPVHLSNTCRVGAADPGWPDQICGIQGPPFNALWWDPQGQYPTKGQVSGIGRVWDMRGCVWGEVEATPGVFNFQQALHTIKSLKTVQGFEKVSYVVGGTPTWLQDPAVKGSNPPGAGGGLVVPGCNIIPGNTGGFKVEVRYKLFVSKLLEAVLKAGIVLDIIEGWNEPQAASYFYPPVKSNNAKSVQMMADMTLWLADEVAQFRKTNKVAWPKVMSPSLLPRSSSSGGIQAMIPYLKAIKANGAASKLDFFSVHIYPEYDNYTSFTNAAKQPLALTLTPALMKKYKIAKGTLPTSFEYWVGVFKLSRDTIKDYGGVSSPKIYVTETNFEKPIVNVAPGTTLSPQQLQSRGAIDPTVLAQIIPGVMNYAKLNAKAGLMGLIWYSWRLEETQFLPTFQPGSPAWEACNGASALQSGTQGDTGKAEAGKTKKTDEGAKAGKVTPKKAAKGKKASKKGGKGNKKNAATKGMKAAKGKQTSKKGGKGNKKNAATKGVKAAKGKQAVLRPKAKTTRMVVKKARTKKVTKKARTKVTRKARTKKVTRKARTKKVTRKARTKKVTKKARTKKAAKASKAGGCRVGDVACLLCSRKCAKADTKCRLEKKKAKCLAKKKGKGRAATKRRG